MEFVTPSDVVEDDYIGIYISHGSFGKCLTFYIVLDSQPDTANHVMILRPLLEYAIKCDKHDVEIDFPLSGMVALVTDNHIDIHQSMVCRLTGDEAYKHILMDCI